MANGMTFGLDGPQVTGWWFNPKTGDKFNAIDTFFEDNNLLIKTADGRLVNYNQIQNYVQVEKPEMIPNKPITPAKKPDDSIPAEILAELDNNEDNSYNAEGLMIPDDDIYSGSSIRDIQTISSNPAYEVANSSRQAIKDFDIIDRALSNKNIPEPVANIEWKNFPKREIEMLIEVMNISEEEIISYYINKISMNIVKDMVAEGIKNFIKKSTETITQSTTKTDKKETKKRNTK